MQFGDEDLDHETAPGFQVPGRVAEAGDLLLLREQTGDGVVDQVDKAEHARNLGRRHVSDGHGHVVAAGLLAQFLSHGLRLLDADDTNASRAQRKSNASRADRELQRRVSAHSAFQEGDCGAQDFGLVHVCG
ncbi:hypothetical protein GCM10020295_79400 [Streptomyces cinereospinus]